MSALVSIVGQPASGKSWLREHLQEALCVPGFAIDDERERLTKGPGHGYSFTHDERAWAALRSRLVGLPAAVVETAGTGSRYATILEGRRVLTIECVAGEEVRRERLTARVRARHFLTLHNPDYAARLARTDRPTSTDVAVDTMDPASVRHAVEMARAFLGGVPPTAPAAPRENAGGGLAPVDELRALPWPVMLRCLDALEAELGPEGVAALRLELDAQGNAGGFWTKPSQAWPDPDASWTTCLFYGENGTGKTWGAQHLFVREILAGRAKRPRIIAATKAAIEKTVLGGASGIKAWLPPLVPFLFLPSKGYEGELYINGIEVLCCSAAAPGQNIGAATDLDYCDDPAGWVESCGEDIASRTWATAARGRREGNARCIVSTTPVFVEFIQNLLRPGRKGVYIVNTGRPEDNAGNLAPNYITDTVEAMRGDGTWLPGVGVSPFRDTNFARLRLDDCPPLVLLGVAIDPSRSVGKKACEVGIVGGGLDARDVVHARKDASAVLDDGQNGWPAVAWDVAEELQREHPGVPVRFILESNTGSGKAELLRAEERARRKAKGLPGNNVAEVVLVKASKNKCERAKPAAMVSEQLQVRIAPDMSEMESQLRQLTPEGKKSDHADAFVHLVRDLGGLGDEKEIRKMATEAEEAAAAVKQTEELAAMQAAYLDAREGAPKTMPEGPLEPMKVEGALPGDSRYAGPAPYVRRRWEEGTL